MPLKPTDTVTVDFKRQTSAAILVDNGLEHTDGTPMYTWLPKSEILNWDELASVTQEGDTIDLVLPVWLIENENLL